MRPGRFVGENDSKDDALRRAGWALAEQGLALSSGDEPAPEPIPAPTSRLSAWRTRSETMMEGQGGCTPMPLAMIYAALRWTRSHTMMEAHGGSTPMPLAMIIAALRWIRALHPS